MNEIPEIYFDTFIINHGPYGVNLTLLTSPPQGAVQGMSGAAGTPRAVLRMSLESAKALAILLRHQLRQFELENLGSEIAFPAIVRQSLGLGPEGW
jgi:hypothetical protein